MPLVSVVCPHCESAVQFQVTHVTRSRPCPECGNTVMLQVAEKNAKVKRKALLMDTQVEETPPPPVDGARASDLPYEPQPLTGEAFERMRMDPEIQRMRNRLVVGGSVVGGLVVVAAILHFTGVFDRMAQREEFEEKFGEVQRAEEVSDEQFGYATPIEKPPEPEPMPPPVSGKLVFSGLDRDGGESSKASASNPDEPFADQRLVLENFLRAPDVDQRVLWVANRQEVGPAMREYAGKRGDSAIRYNRLGKSSSAGQGVTEHEVVLASGQIRMANVLETEDGFRVDWPSFVAWGEMSWQDFRAAKPTEPVLMRVRAAPGGRFENQFGDPSWFRCVNLTHVDDPSGSIVFGYVERNSPLGGKIDYWLGFGDGQPMEMTLRLKYPVDAFSDTQVWITEIVTVGWLVDGSRPGLTRR
jgi:hypothetical protein